MNASLLTGPIQKKLLKKWDMVLESGSEPIRDEHTKVILAQVLENTRNYFIRNGVMLNEGTSQSKVIGTKDNGVLRGSDSYPYSDKGGYGYGDFYLPNVVMPMLRRIMPDLIANELVSVQPLNGPVGFAMAFRPVYGENGSFGKLTSDYEIGYNPVDTRWTGVSAETGLTADPAKEAWAAYGGAAWQGEGADLSTAEWATLGQDYPTVTFQLMKNTVEAKTRKLAANWSPELQEDAQAMHGIDVEKEMVNTLNYEVGAEIDRQIVNSMVKAALIGGSIGSWSPVSADGLDQMGRLATLLTKITMEANQIAVRTKRGPANFVITTPRICAMLEQLGMNKFTSFKNAASIPSVPDVGVGALAKVGLINNDQQLLVRDAAVQGANDYLLMGYKGKQIGDSGIIFCPYIPLTLVKMMQPTNLSWSVAARSRYGIMETPWEAKNYYTFMTIKDIQNNAEYTLSGGRTFVGGQLSEIKGHGPIVMPVSA